LRPASAQRGSKQERRFVRTPGLAQRFDWLRIVTIAARHAALAAHHLERGDQVVQRFRALDQLGPSLVEGLPVLFGCEDREGHGGLGEVHCRDGGRTAGAEE
jgi:hypothetical protein